MNRHLMNTTACIVIAIAMGSGAEAGSFKAGTLTSASTVTSGIGTTTHAFSNPIVVGGAITAVKQPGGGAAGTGMSSSAFAAKQYGYMPNYGGTQINSASHATGAAGTGLSTTAFAAKQYGYMANYGTQTNMASQIIIKSNAPFVPKGAPNVPGQSSSYYYGGAGASAGSSGDVASNTGTATRTSGGQDVVATRNPNLGDTGTATYTPNGYSAVTTRNPNLGDTGTATYTPNGYAAVATRNPNLGDTGTATYTQSGYGVVATRNPNLGDTGTATYTPSGYGVVTSQYPRGNDTGTAIYTPNPQNAVTSFGSPNGYGP